jgi:hypothetical protein
MYQSFTFVHLRGDRRFEWPRFGESANGSMHHSISCSKRDQRSSQASAWLGDAPSLLRLRASRAAFRSSRTQPRPRLGHSSPRPVGFGHRWAVTFDYRALSNFQGPLRSLTGGTQFVTFYQSLTKFGSDRSWTALSSAFRINCRLGSLGLGLGSGRKRGALRSPFPRWEA